MGATTGSANGNEKSPFYALPDKATLAKAGDLPIQDVEGHEIPLKSLYSDRPSGERQLIIFIRHFFCGLCEDYVRALAAAFPPSVLSSTNTTLTLIGCGERVCMPDYITRTGCPFPLYADPSRRLYDTLGMVSNMMYSVKRKSYLPRNLVSVVIGSTWNAVTRPSQALKSGPAAQNGGEWVFRDGELVWCHRMENTSGHVEVAELKEVLSI